MPSSSARVFSVPELVQLISRFSTRSDLARLSQVCRQTFEILIPGIWEKVDGAQNLLGLIKSTALKYDDSTGKLEGIILDENLDSTDHTLFERLDIYAPHVKSLSVYRGGQSVYRVLRWSPLASRAQHHPLLPNLEKLLITNNMSTTWGQDELMWIKIFATRTITQISTNIGYNRSVWAIPSHTASTILGVLVERSPRVQELKIYPYDGPLPPAMASFSPPTVLEKPWYEHLLGLKELRHLEVTEGWFYPESFLTFSQLPNLESIGLYPGYLNGFYAQCGLSPPNLPSGSFPALQQLSFNSLHPRAISDVLRIQETIKSVTQLHISFDSEDLWDVCDDHERWIAHEFLPLITGCPCLEKLTIDINAKGDLILGISEVAHAMAQLPLKTVQLRNLHLGEGPLDLDLGVIWPNVTTLSLPAQHASLQELCYFASLPSLREFFVMLDITTSYTPDEGLLSKSSHAPLRVIQGTYGSELDTKFETMEHNARTLVALWPDLSAVVWRDRTGRPWSSALTVRFRSLLGIYRTLNAIGMEEDKKREAERSLQNMRDEQEHRRT